MGGGCLFSIRGKKLLKAFVLLCILMANEGWVVEEVEDAENQGIPQPAAGTTRRWLDLFGSQNLG